MDLQAHFESIADRDWQTVHAGGPVRFAVVGLGWWTRDEAIPALEESELCEPTVTVSSTTDKAESVAASVSTIEHALTYDEFTDGAAQSAYDAVYIATPNSKHREYVRCAAELGKAILCEKPMEATVERAKDIVDICADEDATCMVAYRMQTEPAIRWVRTLIDDGFIGEPVHVHGHLSQPLLEMIPDPNQWRLNPDLTGYGTSVMDLGPYPINTARFVLGTDPTRVHAMAASTGDAFTDVPDESTAFLLEFSEGCYAACTVGQNAAKTSHLRFVGTAGELTVEPAFFPHDPREVTLRRGETAATVEIEHVDQMREEFDYFADCLLGGRDPLPDAEHGLTDMRIMKAIYDSAERDEPVSL